MRGITETLICVSMLTFMPKLRPQHFHHEVFILHSFRPSCWLSHLLIENQCDYPFADINHELLSLHNADLYLQLYLAASACITEHMLTNVPVPRD